MINVQKIWGMLFSFEWVFFFFAYEIKLILQNLENTGRIKKIFYFKI